MTTETAKFVSTATLVRRAVERAAKPPASPTTGVRIYGCDAPARLHLRAAINVAAKAIQDNRPAAAEEQIQAILEWIDEGWRNRALVRGWLTHTIEFGGVL